MTGPNELLDNPSPSPQLHLRRLLLGSTVCAVLFVSACTLYAPDETSSDAPSTSEAAPKREKDSSLGIEEAYIASAGAIAGRSNAMASLGDVRSPQPVIRSIDRERYEDFTQNAVRVVNEDPVSTFSVDVDTASYAVMRRYVSEGIMPPMDSVRVEELINYFDYDYPLPTSRSQPFKASTWLYPTPWNDGTQILHIGIKGFDLVPEKRPDANLVLLIDVSGSMHDDDKLPLLKKAMRLLVDQMSENDMISIVVYAGAAGTLLEPTKGSDKAKILGALENLQSGGSTAGGEGIRQAYALAEASFGEDKVNRVILATDGDFNVGISNPERLEDFVAAKRDTGIYLTTLGFGRGNYNDVLMQKIAQAGNGNAAYIDSLKEARKVLVEEMGSTLFPIANDVKIQVEFNPAQVAEYRLIGYETRALKREDFNNDKVDAGDIGSGHSVTALYEIVPTNSEVRFNDPLRYSEKPNVATGSDSGEIAFVRVRYKLPEDDDSKLVETPVLATSLISSTKKLPDDVRFAAAVAAYGQTLKGGQYIADMDVDKIRKLAQSGRGEDIFGYRAEFIQLVRLMSTAEPMEAQH